MLDKNVQNRGLSLALVATLCASAAPALSKVVLSYVASPVVLMLRMSFALILLIVLIKFIVNDRFHINKQSVLVAFFGALNFAFFIFGIKYMSTIFTPAFYSLVPIQTTILAWLLFQNKVIPIKLIGILIGLIGTWVIFSETFSGGSTSDIHPLGIVFLLSASISITLYGLFIQNLKNLPSAYNVSLQAIIFGLLLSIPVALFTPNSFVVAKPIDLWFWISILALAGFGTVMQYVFYQNSIRILGTSATVIFFYLQPVFIVIISLLFLDEKLTWHYPLGMTLVLLGSSLNINFVLEKLRLQKNFR